MADRFFCDDLTSGRPCLSGPEAHHAIHVLRLKCGQAVQLFDGAGTVVEAVIEDIQRDRVFVRSTATSFCEPRTQNLLTVAAVPPKGDRLKWMVEKLTELGVDAYVPLQTERSVVDPRRTKLDKLASTVTAAMKQCGRRWRMQIREPQSLPEVLQDSQAAGHRVLLAHPGDTAELPIAVVGHCTVLVGPEGGFTDSEVQLALASSARRIVWPDLILRIETAAVAFAARLRY